MNRTLRALAALLSYPSADLKAHVGEIRETLAADPALRDMRQRLEPLLAALESRDLLDAQMDYTELFDRSRALSLHLFEHVHGDSRDRGQAMIDLGQHYVDRGFYLDNVELPDFIPVFVEFASCRPPAEMRDLLGEPAHVFAALAGRLAERGSPYAAIFDALIAVAETQPDAGALAELNEHAASDPADIDAEWQEEPVTFSRPVHEMGGPTGFVAKFRAAQRAVAPQRSRRIR